MPGLFASSRFSQLAGRVMYAWNDAASLEQLVYADSGRRLLTAAEFTGGQFLIRRYGAMVTLNAVGMIMANGNITSVGLIPSGFRPPYNSYYPYREGVGDPGKAIIAFSNGDIQFRNVANGAGGITAIATWETADAWPTTLPGTASGTLPQT